MAAFHIRLAVASNPILTRLGVKGNLATLTSMMDYNKTRDDAIRRKTEVIERQQKIKEEQKKLKDEAEQNQRELIGLDQILEGLDFVESDLLPDSEPTGFTDNIRKILTETTVPLVPTQIRDSLQARGIAGSSPKNLLINVHKVLERIEPELISTATPDGKTAFKHKATERASNNQTPVAELMAALKKSLQDATEAEHRKSRAEAVARIANAIRPKGGG